MLTVTQYAAMHNLDPSRIRALLLQKRIKGAVKVGWSWIIPDKAKILPPKRAKKK
jgi:hypothetical protein